MFYSSNREDNEKEAARRKEEEENKRFYEHLEPTEITQVGTLIDTSNVKRN